MACQAELTAIASRMLGPPPFRTRRKARLFGIEALPADHGPTCQPGTARDGIVPDPLCEATAPAAIGGLCESRLGRGSCAVRRDVLRETAS